MHALDVQIINAFAGLTTSTDRAVGVTSTPQASWFVNAIPMQRVASFTTGAIPIIHTRHAGHDVYALIVLTSATCATIQILSANLASIFRNAIPQPATTAGVAIHIRLAWGGSLTRIAAAVSRRVTKKTKRAIYVIFAIHRAKSLTVVIFDADLRQATAITGQPHGGLTSSVHLQIARFAISPSRRSLAGQQENRGQDNQANGSIKLHLRFSFFLFGLSPWRWPAVAHPWPRRRSAPWC